MKMKKMLAGLLALALCLGAMAAAALMPETSRHRRVPL